MSPADELRTAADALRPSSPAAAVHAVTVRLPADVAPALADWLTHAADTLHTGRIHGTSLVICEPCCEQLPCQHIRPALAVARAINGTAP
ncbi:hypothetical protein ACFWR9_08950 [Streptomyces sp. NPDC058534]|uniref:hypothetical protein n=1 Tax=Streptomyces sp. NPDC058534 TaxID=3346541 RepID=UPI00365CC18A